jgi:LuxR family quorum sensing-dependent transcriptional regulator
MLSHTLSDIEAVIAATTPEAASRLFYDLLRKQGASYLQTRLYRRPQSPLTSASHFAAGGLIARYCPEGWVSSTAFNYICFQVNPLLDAIRESRTRYRFSDFAAFDDPGYHDYWDAMSEARISDALCATSYGSNRVIASLHLGFERREFGPDEARAIQMAGLLVTERLVEFAEPQSSEPPLTARERDCLAFAADGNTDRQIADLLGISEATVRFHFNNARRKLGAVNRTQAVARLAVRGML